MLEKGVVLMSNKFNEYQQLWEQSVKKTNERFPERKEKFMNHSDIEIDRLYLPKEEETKTDYVEKIGFPGQYPYTRGIQPSMYRNRFWTMRQYAGFGSAKETNKRFRYLLEQGQTGLSVAFDLPTQIGYDSDDPMAEGEVRSEEHTSELQSRGHLV